MKIEIKKNIYAKKIKSEVGVKIQPQDLHIIVDKTII